MEIHIRPQEELYREKSNPFSNTLCGQTNKRWKIPSVNQQMQFLGSQLEVQEP
jgi:hypothetical protein